MTKKNFVFVFLLISVVLFSACTQPPVEKDFINFPEKENQTVSYFKSEKDLTKYLNIKKPEDIVTGRIAMPETLEVQECTTTKECALVSNYFKKLVVECKIDTDAPGNYALCEPENLSEKTETKTSLKLADVGVPIEAGDPRYKWEEIFALGSLNPSLTQTNPEGKPLIFSEETIFNTSSCLTTAEYLGLEDSVKPPAGSDLPPSSTPSGNTNDLDPADPKKYCFATMKTADLSVESINSPEQIKTGTHSFPVITKNIGEFKCCEILYVVELSRGEEYLGGMTVFMTYVCFPGGPSLGGFEAGTTFETGTGMLDLTEPGNYTIKVNMHCQAPAEKNDANGELEKDIKVI